MTPEKNETRAQDETVTVGSAPTISPPGDGEVTPPPLQSLAGETFGHYELQGRIGEGGMGEIYKARDSRLDRIIAIKVLRPELVQRNDLRQRFDREARTVARLNHPHICTLYDIGRHGDTDYLVLEFLQGETLAAKLEKGPLPAEQALRCAIDMADALEQAHRQGITHRDIKPGNIMLTRDGWLKVLDFGLAKLAEETRRPVQIQSPVLDELLTQPGALLGTIAYMSPEQASQGEIDVRSDIFSFGAVLYEMVSGRRPFQGKVPQETIAAILREEPEPLRKIVAHVSADLEKIIGRCLRKDPALRFQTMADVKTALEDLEHKMAASRPEEMPSIAVLPFANPGGEAEDEYFSDGLTEELIHALAQLKDLRGVSRSSAFQFKGRSQDVREAGRMLGVRTILEGSVRRAGSRLRITAQLVNVTDGSPLWAERFDRKLEDFFEIQDEVTRAIVTALKPRLVAEPQALVAKPHAANMEGHELYLKGRYFWNQQTPEGVSKARDYFEQALLLSPGHAMSHVGLADCYLLLTWYGLTPATEAVPKARSAAMSALEIDETVALAHCSLAIVQAGYDWNWPQASERFNRALELGAGFSSVHFHYALDYLTPIGRLDDAVREIQLAQELDPLSLITRTALGGCFYRKGDYDAAIKQFQNTLEIDPDFYHARWSLARALERKYLFEDAVQEFRKADELCRGDNTLIRGELGHCYGLMSQDSKAREILEELEGRSQDSYVSPLSTAFVFLGLGKKDETFQRLEQALEQHSRSLVWINVDPRFERLRPDPRFSHLLKRLGLAE